MTSQHDKHAEDTSPEAPVPPHNVIEQARMPNGQAPNRGEQTGKRTNDERNDANMQPASTDGMPHPPRGQ
ncbi:hypothetical protein SAMN05428989_2690 [Pseudoxanthomonas sp. GM95]|uniref:hypothetical protein n=1 Tax=Pseudoxanthomonas sp. GM95 TaxID=1881043 RepID=UPI0008BD1E60|nr:hypothetical protein [Pseudoxanthomonas sp. GM95]SEL85335.1 hypothetical protein SAMN05428989_2690 [Pseudoxanthomonas sp. GM95]